MLKRFAAVAALALLGSLGVAAPAKADTAGELAVCVTYYSTGVGPSYGGGNYTGSGDWYAYSPTWTVPNPSACEDINMTYRYFQGSDWWYRVRFFPSSGGSYANSWKAAPACNSCSNFVVATDVSNGTRLRIEGHRRIAGAQVLENQNFDMAF